MELLESFNHQLSLSKQILITCHQYPDLDAVGSCLALAHRLSSTHEVYIWIPKENLTDFEFLPLNNFIVSDFPEFFRFDLCIVCDCSNLERVHYYKRIQQVEHSFTMVNIDHHPDNNHFGDINITEKVSSVGELLYGVFEFLNWDITKDIAKCLYAAISFDTGRFAYSNVTSTTLSVASKLVALGVNPSLMSNAIDENKTFNDMQLIKIALENLVVCADKEYAYTVIPKQSPRGSVKVVDIIRQLKNVELVIVFQELQTKLVKVNLRSKSFSNVSKIAQFFGGGGHERAAGIVFEKNIELAKMELLQYIDSR